MTTCTFSSYQLHYTYIIKDVKEIKLFNLKEIKKEEYS